MNTNSPWRAVRLVATREINTRLRTRSFVIGTVVMLALLLGYVVLQATLISSRGKLTVGLTGQATSIAQQLKVEVAQGGTTVDTVLVPNNVDGRSKVESGDFDALVSGSGSKLQVLAKSSLDSKLRVALDRVEQQQELDGILSADRHDPAQVMAQVAARHVDVGYLHQTDPQRTQRLIIGIVVAVLLYISMITYGSLVAQGVVEEKASRVVEILLSTVRPWHLMTGKVIGLGVVGLSQFLIIAGAGLAAATVTGVLTLSGVAAGALAWGLVWYLLGFFLYATIFAAAGSLVSRQEDAQSVVAPVSVTLMIGFVVGINLLIQKPDSDTTAVLSQVPVLSPVLMPGRIAAGLVPPWQVVLSLALMLATIALCTALGGKVYQNAVLRTGSRIKLADAFRG
jgi:ABC-2 type transport system permease protein